MIRSADMRIRSVCKDVPARQTNEYAPGYSIASWPAILVTQDFEVDSKVISFLIMYCKSNAVFICKVLTQTQDILCKQNSKRKQLFKIKGSLLIAKRMLIKERTLFRSSS